jgi:hypothetical protein
MVEVTQGHISVLGISAPPLGGDQRHEESAEYPFLDYDALSDAEEEVKEVVLGGEFNICDMEPFNHFILTQVNAMLTPFARQTPRNQ